MGKMTLVAQGLFRARSGTKIGGVSKFPVSDWLKTCPVTFVGDKFREYFSGIVCKDVSAETLVFRELLRPLTAASILDELAECAEISIAHFLLLLGRQSRGRGGPLSCSPNIAFARDGKGVLRPVEAHCARQNVWHLYAPRIESPFPWGEGSQVISAD